MDRLALLISGVIGSSQSAGPTFGSVSLRTDAGKMIIQLLCGMKTRHPPMLLGRCLDAARSRLPLY
jgi:hypothetical protein